MSQKVIRDPVYDHIYICEENEKLILDLLQCAEVQRLRRIRQLGVSHLTYPGAEHSRFGHSLGAFHLMKTALEYVKKNQPALILGEFIELAAKAAALLHDVGHGPFSHALEEEFGGKHEMWTKRIIEDAETEVNGVLKDHSASLPDIITQLLTEPEPKYTWIKSLLSSQLDVDRMDYLLRDSMYCGVGYGRFDYRWLFHTMRVDDRKASDKRRIFQTCWEEKAHRVIEQYIFARYYMYWNVYFHKTTRGYERLASTIISRVKDLVKQNSQPEFTHAAVSKLFANTAPGLTDYLTLDDHVLLSQINWWARHAKDNILKDLCDRFINRRGLKPVKVPGRHDQSPRDQKDRDKKAQEFLRQRDFVPEYYLLDDLTSTVAYVPYTVERTDAEQSAGNAILIHKNDKLVEISQLPEMSRLKAVTGQKEQQVFFYVPETCRHGVSRILNG